LSFNNFDLKIKIVNSFAIHLYLAEYLCDNGYNVSSTTLMLRMGGFQIEKDEEIFDCTINIVPESEKVESIIGSYLPDHFLKKPLKVIIDALQEKQVNIIASKIDSTSYTPSAIIIANTQEHAPKFKVLLFPTGVLMDRKIPFMQFKPIKEVVKNIYEKELEGAQKREKKKHRQKFPQDMEIEDILKEENIDFRGIELNKFRFG